jgi:hypothetical protein
MNYIIVICGEGTLVQWLQSIDVNLEVNKYDQTQHLCMEYDVGCSFNLFQISTVQSPSSGWHFRIIITLYA